MPELQSDHLEQTRVAYFSMEVALASEIPTYSGGLGGLAGDSIRASADLKVPMVAMTLLHRKGYFSQEFDAKGWQHEHPVDWRVEDFFEEMNQRVTVPLEGRTVYIRAWRYLVKGVTGSTVPVYCLDTDLPDNNEKDRHLTDFLYGGDGRYRLCQEAILGIGGVKMLRALGYNALWRFHMNEGHSSLLGLALLDEAAAASGRPTFNEEDVETVKRLVVFTTHTPVPAGHDRFSLDLVDRVLNRKEMHGPMKGIFCVDDHLNLTHLGLHVSRYVNGVAKRHGEVSREMFKPFPVDAITNGVHVATWTCDPMQDLFDRHMPGWRTDNFILRYALRIPRKEIRKAHQAAKHSLLEMVSKRAKVKMDIDRFTIGFARRAAGYKRADLLFSDMKRLQYITKDVGAIQILYAGKAHPQDEAGKRLIQNIFKAKAALKGVIEVVYLENYDMDLAKQMTAGCDLWLNNPKPPLEASGTSGMKAALNGVPSLSTLDGWWVEGHVEGVTGWTINPKGAVEVPGRSDAELAAEDAASLYEKLEKIIIPMFYKNPRQWGNVMRYTIALNGTYFNAQRMMQQYVLRAYFT